MQSAQSKTKGQIKANLPEPVVFNKLMVDQVYLFYMTMHITSVCTGTAKSLLFFLNKDDRYFM